jgi:pimeloyl-ACP methyl ester carboxylesterase
MGSGASAPLLLVHGFTGSALDWADVQPALARDRRVVAYTHRGHAGSPHTPPYTFDALVDDLASVIDDLDLSPVHLLGHSMGGVVALRLALGNPAKIRSLVLMDTFAEPAGGLPTEMMDALFARVRAEGMAPMVEMARSFVRPEVLARTEATLRATDPDAFVAFGLELRDYPSLVDRLGELAMPVTVMVGANDTNLVQPARVMAERIPGAVLEVIADAGHSPQDDQPEAWLRVVRDHLERAVDR